jgi:hypothetical protein
VIRVAAQRRNPDIRGMALATFDTHELVKDLKAAGFTDDQAEAVTRAVKNARAIDFSDLATKAVWPHWTPTWPGRTPRSPA